MTDPNEVDAELLRLWHEGRSANYYRPPFIPSPRRAPRWSVGAAFFFWGVVSTLWGFCIAWAIITLMSLFPMENMK